MTQTEIFDLITSMLGGLALFLFGMSVMSDSLSRLSGGVLEKSIKSIAKNRYTAFLFGTVITAALQSSSAVTVLTVGLVNSHLIELGQAVGLLIGANLGTTATAWLLSLNAIEGGSLLLTIIKPSSFSPFIALIGVEIFLLSRSDKKKNIGAAMLGFAVMMIGMNLMSKAVSPLGKLPQLDQMMIELDNPLPAFLFAILFTMIIQSSDATVGIIQAFSLTVGMTYGMVIPLICGAQVGTCITALISSLGASKSGKRTAILNLYYNLLKTVPLLTVFAVLNILFKLDFADRYVGGIAIPVIHTLINVIGAVIFLPASGILVALVNRTIPLTEEELEEQTSSLVMLDPLLLSTPSIALEQADRAIRIMADTSAKALRLPVNEDMIREQNDKVHNLCLRIARYRKQIESFLSEIAAKNLSISDAAYLTFLSNVSVSFYRIGVLSEKTLEKYKQLYYTEQKLNDDELSEIILIADSVFEIYEITVAEYEKRTITLASMIRLYREFITEMSDAVKKRHIQQMHESSGNQSQFSIMLDIYQINEQVIDNCDIIAEEMIQYLTSAGAADISSAELDDNKRAQMKALFADKYKMLNIHS